LNYGSTLTLIELESCYKLEQRDQYMKLIFYSILWICHQSSVLPATGFVYYPTIFRYYGIS